MNKIITINKKRSGREHRKKIFREQKHSGREPFEIKIFREQIINTENLFLRLNLLKFSKIQTKIQQAQNKVLSWFQYFFSKIQQKIFFVEINLCLVCWLGELVFLVTLKYYTIFAKF